MNIAGQMTIRTFTFGDLTVFEIPQKNYDPEVVIDTFYSYYVQYHNCKLSMELVGVFTKPMTPEEVMKRYRWGLFNYHDDEDDCCDCCDCCDCEED